ncbi:transcriptional coactivator PipX [Floridanema evergladense]|uniref:Transcriptional coactivator PipX n=1 Tax=Floridaenema evergladense BLCC-F167 TaxID=3153639 RepID=A0ABV4WW82_9CYAN
MSNETYLNHPTFGLLYRVCVLEEHKELYTTLYAQRLFFLVMTSSSGLTCEPISRSDSRLLVENRLRMLRHAGQTEEYDKLILIHQRTFQ